ncbi:hypothetical protein ZIOFF_040293 [Zingiber officinale]|uniref:Uncharacterized protein n=1 Tax=Zingiber officinale TaxID=94328 RepID=A0A8J5G3P4_ZINOF|nr:hypothetical protein ZIOFF_040293 [Zingiber officinale]
MRLLSSRSCPTSPPSPLRKATPNWLQHFDDCVVDNNVRPRLGSDDSEELMHVLHGVAVALGSRPLESPRSLYVTTRYQLISIFLLMHVCWMLDKIEMGDEDDEEESEDSYSEINGDLVLSKITENETCSFRCWKMYPCWHACFVLFSLVATFLCIKYALLNSCCPLSL